MKNLIPLNDRIIIKRLEREDKTSSGIVIPDSASGKSDQGRVVAIGPGKKNQDGKRVPSDLKGGELVLFGKYAGQAIKFGEEELLVMKEEDVLAVIKAD